MSETEQTFAELKSASPVVEQYHKKLGTLLDAERLLQPASDAQIYKIETEKGTWILKEHSTGTASSQITAEQNIIMSLSHNGFTLGVPYIVTDSGEPFVHYGKNCWTVTRFIQDAHRFDWTNPSWSTETCVSAAEGLAQFHLAGYRMLKRSTNMRSEFSPTELNTFTSKFDEAVNQLETSSGLAAAGLKAFTESTDWLREEVASTIKQLNDPTLGTRFLPTVVHGDLHAGNTLFQRDRLVAIIDLHYVHLGSPLYDLAYAAIMFGTNWSRNESLQEAQDVSPAISEFQAAFVMSYRKAVRQINEEPSWSAALQDSDLLHQYMKLACFLIMHWALEPTSSSQDEQTRNRVYLNALSLLRHLDAP